MYGTVQQVKHGYALKTHSELKISNFNKYYKNTGYRSIVSSRNIQLPNSNVNTALLNSSVDFTDIYPTQLVINGGNFMGVGEDLGEAYLLFWPSL